MEPLLSDFASVNLETAQISPSTTQSLSSEQHHEIMHCESLAKNYLSSLFDMQPENVLIVTKCNAIQLLIHTIILTQNNGEWTAVFANYRSETFAKICSKYSSILHPVTKLANLTSSDFNKIDSAIAIFKDSQKLQLEEVMLEKINILKSKIRNLFVVINITKFSHLKHNTSQFSCADAIVCSIDNSNRGLAILCKNSNILIRASELQNDSDFNNNCGGIITAEKQLAIAYYLQQFAINRKQAQIASKNALEVFNALQSHCVLHKIQLHDSSCRSCCQPPILELVTPTNKTMVEIMLFHQSIKLGFKCCVPPSNYSINCVLPTVTELSPIKSLIQISVGWAENSTKFIEQMQLFITKLTTAFCCEVKIAKFRAKFMI